MARKKNRTQAAEKRTVLSMRGFLAVFMLMNFLAGAFTGQAIFFGVGIGAAIVAYIAFLRNDPPRNKT